MEGDLRWRGPDKSVETVTADWTGGMEEAAKKAGGVPWRGILQEPQRRLDERTKVVRQGCWTRATARGRDIERQAVRN